MALRTYKDADGGEWRVWRVVADSISFSTLGPSYRDGWLCFERADGSERRRLAMSQAPADWDAMSDDMLAKLCRSAEPANRRWATMSSDTSARDSEKGPR